MRSIIWIFIDSLSQLLINKDDSPFLWEELSNSLWFTQCVTTTPYTRAAFYSQITGRYAQHNGCNAYYIPKDRFEKKPYCDQSDVVNVFRRKGYHTVLHSPFAGGLNLLTGFTEAHTMPSQTPTKDEFENIGRPLLEPFFWCYHYTGFLRGLKGSHARKRIQETLRGDDRRIENFVKNHVKPQDIVVYSSDHGFGTKESQKGAPAEKHHGVTLMECCIRTMFAIKGTELSDRISQMVRSVDVGPTILGLIGEELDDTDGINLVPYVEGRKIPNLEAIIETGPGETSRYHHSRFGVRDNDYKYVFAADAAHLSEHLYSSTIMEPVTDVVDDDGIIVENPELLEWYREKVLAYLEQYNLGMQREQLLELKRNDSM